MSAKAAVGALVGGLGGATIAILGRAFFARKRHLEAFDAVTTSGLLVGSVIGAAIGDSFGVTTTPSVANTAMAAPTSAPNPPAPGA